MEKQKIINVGVIAHVDAGKSTLVDALLKQSGVFRENETLIEQVMDSNDLERERGITIYSKNCAIRHEDIKINIVDTPGHADFSSEVERIMQTLDTVILLVDAAEGPMPQTRVVLKKSLEAGLRPILFINKIDKKDARALEVENMSFDLFSELGAEDEQLDFPIVYGVAKDGIATTELSQDSTDLTPLFDVILKHVDPYPDLSDENLQLQISQLGYDDYLGRLGMGRITKGTIKLGEKILVNKRNGTMQQAKISRLFVHEGLSRVEVDRAYAGDMAVIAGLSDVSIGETINNIDKPDPLPMIEIEKPTLQMTLLVNDSPFVGRSGHLVTTRQIRDRLHKELETNVGLEVKPLEGVEGFTVSGRGELHISILLENMRREGFELAVSKPRVLLKDIDGKTHEPFEHVRIHVPEDDTGTVISEMNHRRGVIQTMEITGDFATIKYLVPTRGLIGFRNFVINTTSGEGSIERSFEGYQPYAGNIDTTRKGVLISQNNGKTTAYSLFNLSERGIMFVPPMTEVYEGMIVGLHAKENDLVVNPIKGKQLTNVRSSGADEAIRVQAPRVFTLEEALEFINEDELVEITPDAIRLRKRLLKAHERKRDEKSKRHTT